MALEFEAQGLSELYAALQEFPVRFERNIMRGGLRAGVNVFRDEARNFVSDKKDLARSIKSSTDVRRGVGIAKVRAGDAKAFYAHMLEFGTASYYVGSGKSVRRPYKIGATKKGKVSTEKRKPLSFPSRTGSRIARASAIHPGIRPIGYMRRAFDGYQRQAIEAMQKYIHDRIIAEAQKIWSMP